MHTSLYKFVVEDFERETRVTKEREASSFSRIKEGLYPDMYCVLNGRRFYMKRKKRRDSSLSARGK